MSTFSFFISVLWPQHIPPEMVWNQQIGLVWRCHKLSMGTISEIDDCHVAYEVWTRTATVEKQSDELGTRQTLIPHLQYVLQLKTFALTFLLHLQWALSADTNLSYLIVIGWEGCSSGCKLQIQCEAYLNMPGRRRSNHFFHQSKPACGDYPQSAGFVFIGWKGAINLRRSVLRGVWTVSNVYAAVIGNVWCVRY